MAALFHAGDVVSCGYGFGVIVTGRVVERQGRYGPYLKVVITAHPKPERIGQVEHADASWQLGVGDQHGVCERCRRPYRWSSTAPQELPGSCASCAPLDNGELADPSQGTSHWDGGQRRRRRA